MKEQFHFFYGSKDSKFWSLYRKNIDNTIVLPIDIESVLLSLSQRQIAISDTIVSCERHERSSEDSKLIRRKYNIIGLQTLIQNGVRKIICTSKGVLKDFEKQVILSGTIPFGQIDNLSACIFQDNFIASLGGNNNQITSPISKVFIVDGEKITVLAIPSPGSPQRQLAKFGFNGQDWRIYADNYFKNAFNWLNE